MVALMKQMEQRDHGPMGRALAISKLESINSSVNSLEKNLEDEAATIKESVDEMMKKH